MKKKILSLIMIFSLVLSGCDLLGGAGNETETESAAVGITDVSDTAEQTDWQDFKKALILRTAGGMALSQTMSETGEDVFQFIDPNAVG